MTVNAKAIREETIHVVPQLISVLRDSQNELINASNHVGDKATVRCLYQLAADRAEFENQLRAYMTIHKESVPVTRNFFGSVRRLWANVRTVLYKGKPSLVLSVVEKAEDALQHCYEELLAETSGDAIHDLLRIQYERVKDGRDRVGKLKDQLQAA